MGQLFEVERQGCVSHAEAVGDLAGRHPLRTLLDEQAKDVQSGFLRQASQCREGGFLFHVSSFMELLATVKPLVLPRLDHHPRRAVSLCGNPVRDITDQDWVVTFCVGRIGRNVRC